jgi:hypothetical protein
MTKRDFVAPGKNAILNKLLVSLTPITIKSHTQLIFKVFVYISAGSKLQGLPGPEAVFSWIPLLI